MCECVSQNLGEEGTAYVVEALAFNNTCLALDLSNNGIARLGTGAMCQVLPTCSLQTLVLSTNSVGDEGAELLAKTISGACMCVCACLCVCWWVSECGWAALMQDSELCKH